MQTVRSIDAPAYVPSAGEDETIAKALDILARRVRTGPFFTSPLDVKNYARLQFAGADTERFAVFFLDAQHRLIADETLFTGTVDQTAVYPREVVRRALHHNASALVLAHNHPSGTAEPSAADERLTQAIKTAAAVVDVRVLDHLVIGNPSVVSFAERGLI
jgi:DNA repair protein RadC